MRPVVKLAPGTYPCGNGSTIHIDNDYHDYTDAKAPLVFNLGCMCSYCEKTFDDERELAVEHIQAKKYMDEKAIIHMLPWRLNGKTFCYHVRPVTALIIKVTKMSFMANAIYHILIILSSLFNIKQEE